MSRRNRNLVDDGGKHFSQPPGQPLASGRGTAHPESPSGRLAIRRKRPRPDAPFPAVAGAGTHRKATKGLKAGRWASRRGPCSSHDGARPPKHAALRASNAATDDGLYSCRRLLSARRPSPPAQTSAVYARARPARARGRRRRAPWRATAARAAEYANPTGPCASTACATDTARVWARAETPRRRSRPRRRTAKSATAVATWSGSRRWSQRYQRSASQSSYRPAGDSSGVCARSPESRVSRRRTAPPPPGGRHVGGQRRHTHVP